MTVEQGQAGIVRCKSHFDFLISSDHNDILHDACSRYSRELGEFETVPVKMDRMNVVAGIVHPQAVTLALLEMVSGCHRIARKHRVINSPQVESVVGRVPLCKGHVNHFVWLCGSSVSLGEASIIPMERLGRCPARLSFVPRVLNDNAHAVTAVIVRKITHNPYTWMMHLDDGRNAFRRSKPEHRHFHGSGYRIAVQRDDFEGMPRQCEAANLGRTAV